MIIQPKEEVISHWKMDNFDSDFFGGIIPFYKWQQVKFPFKKSWYPFTFHWTECNLSL